MDSEQKNTVENLTQENMTIGEQAAKVTEHGADELTATTEQVETKTETETAKTEETAQHAQPNQAQQQAYQQSQGQAYYAQPQQAQAYQARYQQPQQNQQQYQQYYQQPQQNQRQQAYGQPQFDQQQYRNQQYQQQYAYQNQQQAGYKQQAGHNPYAQAGYGQFHMQTPAQKAMHQYEIGKLCLKIGAIFDIVIASIIYLLALIIMVGGSALLSFSSSVSSGLHSADSFFDMDGTGSSLGVISGAAGALGGAVVFVVAILVLLIGTFYLVKGILSLKWNKRPKEADNSVAAIVLGGIALVASFFSMSTLLIFLIALGFEITYLVGAILKQINKSKF